MSGLITKQELSDGLRKELEEGGIIQSHIPPDGIKEGRLWLDTSDDGFQGTVLEGIQNDLANKISVSEKGKPNGVATLDANGNVLDGNGRISSEHMEFIGEIDFSVNPATSAIFKGIGAYKEIFVKGYGLKHNNSTSSYIAVRGHDGIATDVPLIGSQLAGSGVTATGGTSDHFLSASGPQAQEANFVLTIKRHSHLIVAEGAIRNGISTAVGISHGVTTDMSLDGFRVYAAAGSILIVAGKVEVWGVKA